MSNKQIAINWATKQVNQATGFVYSDKFFIPFTNPHTRNKITNDLLSKNVVVWPDNFEGAFLFKKGDPRLKIHSNGTLKAGVWIENENILLLPQMNA